MEEDNSLSSVYFMLAVNSHVSMQGHHCLPLRVWLWGECVLCVTVRVIMDLEGDHAIGETFPLFLRNRSVWICVCVFFFYIPFPEFNLVETIKETRQMAYPHCLIWRDHLNWVHTASTITSVLKNLVVGPGGQCLKLWIGPQHTS